MRFHQADARFNVPVEASIESQQLHSLLFVKHQLLSCCIGGSCSTTNLLCIAASLLLLSTITTMLVHLRNFSELLSFLQWVWGHLLDARTR
jgi:hypothetical protein